MLEIDKPLSKVNKSDIRLRNTRILLVNIMLFNSKLFRYLISDIDYINTALFSSFETFSSDRYNLKSSEVCF